MTKKEGLLDFIKLIPIIMAMGFISTIVHAHVYDTKLSQFEWFPDAGTIDVDVFLFWKMVAIIIVGIVMLILAIDSFVIKKQKPEISNSFYFLFFYALFVGMAALFSPYKYWVNRGVFAMQESVWVIFSYIMFCFYTSQVIKNESQIFAVVRWSAIGVFYVTLIGLFEFMGCDISQTDIWNYLTFDKNILSQVEIQEASYSGSVTSTLLNPDYSSFYFGMLIPISFAMILASKRLIGKVVSCVFFVMACVCLYGAHITTSYFSIGGAMIIMLLIFASRNKKTFKIGIVCYVVLSFFVIGFCILTDYGHKVMDVLWGTYDWGEEGYFVYDVRTEDNFASLEVYGKKIQISYEYGERSDEILISCKDEDGNEIQRVQDENYEWTEYFVDSRFPDVTVTAGRQFEMNAVRLGVKTSQWIFTKDIDGTYYYLNPAGKFVKTKEVKRAALFHEDALSGRGRLWNRILPLLPKHFFVGSGANTFVFEYPQHDYLYRAQTGENNTLDVKAHNWYLQQMVETGVIGTVLLLIFLGWYVVKSIRIYRRANLKNSITIMGLGMFTAVLVYLIAALANDSNVCTAPVFWCVLGLGMAVNEMIVKQEGLVLGKLVAEGDGIEDEVTDSKSNVRIVMQRTSDANRDVSPEQNVEASGENSARKNSGKKQSRKQRKKQK